jgi:hypothetical protein
MFGYKLSYRIKVWRVYWRRWKNSLDNHITPDENKISTPFQEKGIKLWRLCLKDNSTKLAFNTNGIRQIEKENLLLVFQHNPSGESVMTIMDINENNKNIYELNILNKQSIYVCDLFDDEMDKRMSLVESTKRQIIETDLDNLLVAQETLLRTKIQKNNSQQ